MAAKIAGVLAVGALNAVPVFGPRIVDGIRKGAEIQDQIDLNNVKCRSVEKIVERGLDTVDKTVQKVTDKGLDIIDQSAKDLRDGYHNGCLRGFNRVFSLVADWNKWILASAIQVGAFGMTYVANRMKKESCSRTDQDPVCIAFAGAVILPLVAGVAGIACITFKAATSVDGKQTDSQDFIRGSRGLRIEENLRINQRKIDQLMNKMKLN